MRAPGGSFIWPNTSIVFSSTPDSFISSHRSLPSRERSPTPQNADRPSCSSARLRISSWMITVLPTPAPPNSPTLPPLAYGASRSTTLIPVSNISCVGVSSSTGGASWWIGRRSTSAGSSGPKSIGSPSRLKMRPSVARPTGTLIGPPVSVTSAPRARPSVVSIATARTRSSPRCCWTSHTSTPSPAPALIPGASSSAAAAGRATVMAWLISGSCSGKTASITTPWISSMRPTFRCPGPPSRAPAVVVWGWAVLASIVCRVLLSSRIGRPALGDQALGAGHDLHDLLCDLGLARAVHLQRQVGDDLAGVVGGAAHRRHLGAEEARGGLDQRAIDRDLDVVGHEALEQVLGLGLVLDQRARPLLGALLAPLRCLSLGAVAPALRVGLRAEPSLGSPASYSPPPGRGPR